MIPPTRIIVIEVWIILPTWRVHITSHIYLFDTVLLKHWTHIHRVTYICVNPTHLGLLRIPYIRMLRKKGDVR